MLVSDLLAATQVHQTCLGSALILLGNTVHFLLRFAGKRPAELPLLTLLQLPTSNNARGAVATMPL